MATYDSWSESREQSQGHNQTTALDAFTIQAAVLEASQGSDRGPKRWVTSYQNCSGVELSPQDIFIHLNLVLFLFVIILNTPFSGYFYFN